MRVISSLLVLALIVCAALPASAAPRNDAERQLQALLNAADEDDLRLNPQSALTRGDQRYAGEFGDLISNEYFARTQANLRKQLAALKRIERERLAAKERIAYDTFKYQAEFALAQHSGGIVRIGAQLPIDHLFGQQLTFQQLSAGGGVAPYKTVADYQNGLKRFKGFVRYLDRAVGRMKEGLSEGRVQPRIVTEKVIAGLDAELANRPEASPFYQPINAMPASFTPPTRSRFADAYRKAIVDELHPALKRMRDFMATDYLAAGREDAPGIGAIPGGGAYYESQLEAHTTTRMSADEIHRLGLEEVARIRAEMAEIQRNVGFEGDYQAFVRHLQSDKRFQFESQEALLDAYRTIGRRVSNLLPRYFAIVPRASLEVRPVPREQEASASAYYILGAPDGSRPGALFVNTSNLPTRTTPRMTALYLHEGLPGHHLQGSLAAEDVALPALLRFGWNPGFGEGWALYAEWLGKEMGLYDDPYQYFGRLDMEVIRAVRLVVDTGLHSKGWSRRQSIDYMLANTTLDVVAVEQEVDRYIVWPGQATAYKVGELYIRKLRSHAERELGPVFDVRRFHAVVLDTGALPLHVLGQKVDAWIVSEKQPKGKGS